jgi:hypothetical protein
MNRDNPATNQSPLRKILWVVLAMAFILLLTFSALFNRKSANDQGRVITPSDTLPATQGVVNSLSPSPYPKDFPQLSINIDQVATFQDRYFIRGNLSSEGIYGLGGDVDTSKIVLTDSTGKQIPVEPLDYALNMDEPGFSLYTREKGASGPMTLTVTSAEFGLQFDVGPNQTNGPHYDVDFGDNPQQNQEWLLNNDFDFAGHHVHLSSVKAIMQDNRTLVEFTMRGEPYVTGVLVLDPIIQAGSSSSFDTAFQDGQIITHFEYPDGFPKGKHEFRLAAVTFNAQGNWQISFDPASIDKQPSAANSEFHNACFLNENWMTQESLPTNIPAGLSGMLLVDNQFTGSASPSMATMDLNGGEKRNLLSLGPFAFSPDGTMIVYYDWQAYKGHTTNLYNGEEKEYLWNKAPSSRISWLIGSDLIAYGSDDGIYISHVDGTGLYKINGTDAEDLLGGWLPDGQHLLVSRTSYKNPMRLQMVDIASGETKDRFPFYESYGIAAIPSPDGKKILFEDAVTGTQQQGIFIANLDGSERHLIASFWRMQIGSYTWSPDGKWVIISVTDVKHGNEITNFLINPDSCQTFRLSNIDWAVRAWALLP